MSTPSATRTILALCVGMLLAACSSPGGDGAGDVLGWRADGAAPTALVPEPERMASPGGAFVLMPAARIGFEGEGAGEVARYLAERLRPATGFEFPVAAADGSSFSIRLVIDESRHAELGDEGYVLETRPPSAIILAARPAGLFYGCQTFCQLLPPAIDGDAIDSGPAWEGAVVEIVDRPRFRWRGLHLDCGRHFFDVDTVKRYVDLLSRHKMNSFHWHLTEDQGWRLEVPGYPELTTISAKRKETPIPANRKQGDGVPYGPYFYTSEEIREVVAYAAERFVNVVPEIEMPGHSLAALAAYPELACTEGPFEVGTRWGVFDDVYCAGKEETFRFLQKVLDHTLELFPSVFIHVGGDECPKKRWQECAACQKRIETEGLEDEHELQSWFIARMERYLAAKGRRLIGWDEILEGGLPAGATVMSWRGTAGGVAAAKAGHDVVMSPNADCYLDHYQSKDQASEPPAIGGFTSCRDIYLYEPVPEGLTEEEAKHVLGAQGNVWTEYIPTPEQVEYMAYPRASALAERLWSPRDRRDWPEFRGRLDHHLERLARQGVSYRRFRAGE